MNIKRTEARLVDNGLRDNGAECDDNIKISIGDGVYLVGQVYGLENGNAMMFGAYFDWRGSKDLFSSCRFIGIGDYELGGEACIHKRIKRRHGKIRRAEENDARGGLVHFLKIKMSAG